MNTVTKSEKVQLLKTETLKVRLTFTSNYLGTAPMDEEVYALYIAQKATKKSREEEQDVVRDMGKFEEKGWTRILRDKTGLFLSNHMLKGFLKHAGLVLAQAHGIKAMASKIDDVVTVNPRFLYLQRDGKKILQEDGVNERPIRMMTPQGPRVSLIRSDEIKAGAYLDAEIQLLLAARKGEVTLPLIRGLLDYGQINGLGQWRNGGYGQFTWEEME